VPSPGRSRQKGRLPCSPATALIAARLLVKDGLYHPENPEVASELTELGYPGDELMREAIQLAFNEVSPEAFQVDPAPQSTPAFLFCLALAMFQKANVLEVQTGRDKKEARIVDIFMPRRSL
jgi:hypothetical protein